MLGHLGGFASLDEVADAVAEYNPHRPRPRNLDGLRTNVPKALRGALGLTPGGTVDLSLHGAGLQLVPSGRTARLREVDGRLVAESDTVVTDVDVLNLLDAGRR